MNWPSLSKLYRDPAGATGAVADPAMRVIRDAAAEAQRSRLPQMAAALSFRTIFGIIPVVVVALVIVRGSMSTDIRNDIIKRALEYTGVSQITVNSGPGISIFSQPQPEADPAGAPGDDSEGSVRPRKQLMGPPVPDEIRARDTGSTELEKRLISLLNRAESSISFNAIGWIGFAILVYAAVAMLVEIERAFNQVFRVPRGRSWVRRVVNYWTIVTLGGLGLLLTFYVSAQFETWATHLSQTRGWTIGSGVLTVRLIKYLVTVFISTLMLTLVYESVPNTRVKPLPALAGAIVAAILWEAGKFAFELYILYATGYARLYGSLALVPLFLLWVYYTWLIVLFGLQVTYQLQHGRSKTRAQPLSDFGPTVVEPSAGLLVMAAVARAMAAGAPQSVRALAKSTGLSEPVVSLVLSRFAERGLLLRVDSGSGRTEDEEPRYTLARTPGSIRVAEILAIGFDLAGGPEANPVVARLRQAQIDAAGSETLADAAGLTGDSPTRARVRPASQPELSLLPGNGPGGNLPSAAAEGVSGSVSGGSANPRPATL